MNHGKDPHLLLMALKIIFDCRSLGWNRLSELYVWRNALGGLGWLNNPKCCTSKLEPTRSFESELARDWIWISKRLSSNQAMVKDQSKTHSFCPFSLQLLGYGFCWCFRRVSICICTFLDPLNTNRLT